MVDAISRQVVLDALDEIETEIAEGRGFQYSKWRRYFLELPSEQLSISVENDNNLQQSCNNVATDTISRRLAIDKLAAYIYHAFKDFYRIGLHRKTLTPEQCRRVARNVLAEVPFAQPYTDEEIQKIQDLEQAQFAKIHELAYQEGKADAMQWIPFRSRPMTEEEKEMHPDIDSILDCKLPDDGQMILVTIEIDGRRWVNYDEYYEDGGSYLDSGYEICTEATAWMPLPEPYKEDDK